MRRRLGLIISILPFLALALSACGAEMAAPVEKARVAFLYAGQSGEAGWSREHERGQEMVAAQLGEYVEIVALSAVPAWDTSAAERAIRALSAQGADMVFATSFGYMEPTISVASDFPDIFYEQCAGYKTASNVATYFGRMYQPMYLAGFVAGGMAEKGVIGYVANHPIPAVIRRINAFVLGVRAANAAARVRVVWTNVWYDAVLERQAAETLLDGGADIIAQDEGTIEPQKAAQARGKLSIGYGYDMAALVGDSVLTSPVWNWGPYYVERVQAMLDGTWASGQTWGGMQSGMVALAPLSPRVPADVVAALEQARGRILGAAWDVFCGPIAAHDGSIGVQAGECLSDAEMLGFNWFVAGVEGTVPAP
jgi:basic membrane protein A